MTVGVEGDLRQLAPQPHEAIGVLQRPLEGEGQLGDGVGLCVALGLDGCGVFQRHRIDIGFRSESRTLGRCREMRFPPPLRGREKAEED